MRLDATQATTLNQRENCVISLGCRRLGSTRSLVFTPIDRSRALRCTYSLAFIQFRFPHISQGEDGNVFTVTRRNEKIDVKMLLSLEDRMAEPVCNVIHYHTHISLEIFNVSFVFRAPEFHFYHFITVIVFQIDSTAKCPHINVSFPENVYFLLFQWIDDDKTLKRAPLRFDAKWFFLSAAGPILATNVSATNRHKKQAATSLLLRDSAHEPISISPYRKWQHQKINWHSPFRNATTQQLLQNKLKNWWNCVRLEGKGGSKRIRSIYKRMTDWLRQLITRTLEKWMSSLHTDV